MNQTIPSTLRRSSLAAAIHGKNWFFNNLLCDTNIRNYNMQTKSNSKILFNIHSNCFQVRNITSNFWSKIGDNLQNQITEWISAIQKEDQQFSQPQPLLLPLNIENQTLAQRKDPTNQEVTVYIKDFWLLILQLQIC
ncbi:hypothetical protein C9374_007691 [Naegleria lovaniensis]|uniref:Uncharacterized protein n=1 Tax=Naegleria lovaniensis TaxID=51637 RepID=A0AA88GI70_NAELO|nr:uncharacterized protein C9374_007691 [Naegleria lovaniensis]KAG2379053.1 hypothetical protein C9374_007691 [Naegleria lovaniensis]